jgi:2-desacetyl-2-hydroxyethyl bacteriochlorophyllide A dehydrogenase
VRALVIEQPRHASVTDVARPEPAAGEVLVRVAATGICGSDVEILEGRRPAPYVRYPVIPGHEWAGTVEALGAGVTGIEPGAPVVAEGFRACNECARCAEGRTNLCEAEYAETGFTHPGACAEFLSVPASLVHVLPADADLEAAALLEPAACVAGGLLEAELRPGLSVAVVGSGTLGLLAVLLLRLVSPARLTLVGTRPARLALGRELGADETIDAADALPAGQFDLVFEAANRPAGAQLALRLARRGGTVVLEGISGVEEPALTADLISLGNLRVQGIFGASRAAWRWVVDLFAQGQLDPGRLVTHRLSLERHDEAFALLGDRSAGALKVQLLPNGSA